MMTASKHLRTYRCGYFSFSEWLAVERLLKVKQRLHVLMQRSLRLVIVNMNCNTRSTGHLLQAMPCDVADAYASNEACNLAGECERLAAQPSEL